MYLLGSDVLGPSFPRKCNIYMEKKIPKHFILPLTITANVHDSTHLNLLHAPHPYCHIANILIIEYYSHQTIEKLAFQKVNQNEDNRFLNKIDSNKNCLIQCCCCTVNRRVPQQYELENHPKSFGAKTSYAHQAIRF